MARPPEQIVQRERDRNRADENARPISGQQRENHHSADDADCQTCKQDRHVAPIVDAPERP